MQNSLSIFTTQIDIEVKMLETHVCIKGFNETISV